MRKMIIIIFVISTLSITACEIVPEQETTYSEHKTTRTLVLGGEQVEESELGEFTSWKCRHFTYGGKTLVEVGRISSTDDSVKMLGFVLYDGTNTGDLTLYKRRGLNLRWDWGPEGESYSFIIQPDGIGLFYDFSTAKNGKKSKADDIYKCSR